MESLKFSFYQDTTELNFEFNLSEAVNARKITGTVLFELFKWLDIQKEMGSKGLKLSQPVDIRISSPTFSIDTCEAQKELRQRLKVNSTNKSKRRFAERFQALTAYITTPMQVVDFNDVITLLTD